MVGLNYSQGEIDFDNSEPIEITFEVNQGFVPYIKSLPIHNSQQFIKELDSGNCVLSLRLITNYELVQAFLRIGDQTKVLSPPFL